MCIYIYFFFFFWDLFFSFHISVLLFFFFHSLDMFFTASLFTVLVCTLLPPSPILSAPLFVASLNRNMNSIALEIELRCSNP